MAGLATTLIIVALGLAAVEQFVVGGILLVAAMLLLR